ncbi:hypothetical protein [Gordonia sp. NPDC003376]
MHNLHDVRLRKLSAKLRTDDDLTFTYTQLVYAAARGRLPRLGAGWSRSALGWTIAVFVVVDVLTVASAAFLTSRGGDIAGMLPVIIACGVVAIIASVVVNVVRRPAALRKARVGVDVAPADVVAEVERYWKAVYRESVPGAVNDDIAALPACPNPKVAVVCPSRSVLVCLAANGFADRYAMALVHRPEDAPSDLPILLLHDASPAGTALAEHARSRFGPRVRDVGLAPRMVMDSEKALILHEPALSAAEVAALPSGLSERERDWLAYGWWSPIAAVPPRKLLSAVERALAPSRAGEQTAHGVGFLTWPAA